MLLIIVWCWIACGQGPWRSSYATEIYRRSPPPSQSLASECDPTHTRSHLAVSRAERSRARPRRRRRAIRPVIMEQSGGARVSGACVRHADRRKAFSHHFVKKHAFRRKYDYVVASETFKHHSLEQLHQKRCCTTRRHRPVFSSIFDHVDVSTLERADRSRLLLRSFLTNACVVPFHEQEAGSTRQSAR